jgi:uncharacterized membrane protein
MMIRDWQARLIQLLSVPGIVIAYYLLLYHNGAVVLLCGTGGWDDCGKVSGPGAPYSTIGPVPVALIGLIGYTLIFLVVWLQDWLPFVDDNLPELLTGLTGLAFVFTLFLTGLELFVIHAFCRYCLVSAAIITIMFALALSHLLSSRRVTATPDDEDSVSADTSAPLPGR